MHRQVDGQLADLLRGTGPGSVPSPCATRVGLEHFGALSPTLGDNCDSCAADRTFRAPLVPWEPPMHRSILFNLASMLCLTAAAQAQAPVQVSWTTAARAYKGRVGEPIALTCPPGGWPGTVWGTDTYTDDSSICTAAVHAGVITFATGGPIALQMKPGQGSYRGTIRNGVSSERYQAWDGSFSVSAYTPPPPPAPPAAPPPPPVISWQRDAVGLAPNGRRFTFVCRPPAVAAVVKGLDIYSWDSSICNAAVHAGAITAAKGGTVIIEMRPSEASYAGSTRNGITSSTGTRTTLAFVVISGK